MPRIRFRNRFLKNPTYQNKLIYNKERNFYVSLLRKKKKEYFELTTFGIPHKGSQAFIFHESIQILYSKKSED